MSVRGYTLRYAVRMMRPRAVQEQLGISNTTLRRWCAHFQDYLGPTAGAAIGPTGGPAQRRFTDEDLAVLARVKALLADGMTYEEVAVRLRRGDVVAHDERRHQPPAESATAPDEAAMLRAVLAERERTIEALHGTIRAQAALLAHLQPRALPPGEPVDRDQRPWWQRLPWRKERAQ